MNWQVSDLESSRKLKELGVRQKSLFVWAEDANIFFEGACHGLRMNHHNGVGISAFTCAELGVALPHGYYTEGNSQGYLGLWALRGTSPKSKGNIPLIVDENEAECRAKILIYLLENKITTVEEVNARLLGVGK